MSVESSPIRWVSGAAVVTVPREVDVSTADDVRNLLLSAINQGAATLVIDMTATTFCDSSGVNAVIRAHRRASASGATIRMVVGSASVRRVFEITKIDHLIPIYVTVEEALAVPAGGAAPAGGAGDRA